MRVCGGGRANDADATEQVEEDGEDMDTDGSGRSAAMSSEDSIIQNIASLLAEPEPQSASASNGK